jgi:cytosine/adenosine deaminase-related metal-dependent hydrolase
VLVGEDGRIVAVGPDSTVPSPPAVPAERLSDAVLLPGLINTHTHLELTGFDGAVPDDDFPTWIRHIIALKAGRSAAEFLDAARQGIRDGWASGVTTIGDTGDSGSAIQALCELEASGIAYHEVFGPHPHQADTAITLATSRLDELQHFTGPRVRLGVSPHAPYSVSGPLYRRVAGLAAERSLPMAVHLAESGEESLLLMEASGGFARAWETRGIPLPPLPGRSPVAWLDQHAVLSPRTLCIHVVHANAADLDLLASRGAAVAHCPRSNRRHAGSVAPLAGMLERGMRVGVGTDSVASVSPLELLAEARAAREIAGLGAEAALRLVTLDAARALGMEGEVGSISPGKWGDLVALNLPQTVDAGQLAGTVLARLQDDVRLTVVAGRQVYRRSLSEAS